MRTLFYSVLIWIYAHRTPRQPQTNLTTVNVNAAPGADQADV
jgi:hypothetical protein